MMDFIKTACCIGMIIFGAWAAYRMGKPKPALEPESPKERLTDEQEQQLNEVIEVYVQRADLLRQQDNLLHGQPVSVIFRDNKNLSLSQEAISTAIEIDVAQKNQDLCRLYHKSSPKSGHKSSHKIEMSYKQGSGARW